jgi:hypothetical protein
MLSLCLFNRTEGAVSYLTLLYIQAIVYYLTLRNVVSHSVSCNSVFHVLTSNSKHSHSHTKNTTDSTEENSFDKVTHLAKIPCMLSKK